MALGYPANQATRDARSKLHYMRLDPMWKERNSPFTRHQLYQLLAEEMGLTPAETHVGKFTIEQCREAWLALGRILEKYEEGLLDG